MNIPSKSLPSLLQHFKKEQIRALLEVLFNIRKFAYSNKEKKRLSRYNLLGKQLLSAIGKNRRVNMSNTRNILTKNKQVGGFLPLLLLPIIAKAALAGAVSTGTGLAIKAIADSAK